MAKKELVVEQATNNPVVNLALDTIRLGKQALVFLSTRPSAEKAAEDIAKHVAFGSGKGDEIRALSAIAEDALHSLASPTKQCERLERCVRKGTAFHHSGLTSKQRQLVEDNFRSGRIKVICATPTLAAGVDLPAFRAIIRDLKRFTQHGYDWIPVLDYLQFAGRAGRPKYDTEGQVITIASSEGDASEITERYINGSPEEVYSKLAVEPALRTYLLSLIATGFVGSKREILEFFGRTFWAHQFRDMKRLEAIIDRMLGLLEAWQFISSGSKSEFVTAADMEDNKVKPTRLGSRVAELYIDPLTAHDFITGLGRSASKGISNFTLLQLVSQTLELKPLLRVKAKEYESVQEQLAEFEGNLLVSEPSMFESDYDDFLASVKTALFFMEWIDEKDEEYLLEKFSIRPGEIRSKLANADWLIYALEELAKILQFRNEFKEISKLRFRAKYGVREELLPLLQIKGIGRVRGRKLFNNGIKTIADAKKADISTLTQVLGSGKVALEVKKHLGQEVKEVSRGKRKGQLGLGKFEDNKI